MEANLVSEIPEITKYLQENEEILWKQIRTVNLYIIKGVIISILFLIIFSFFALFIIIFYLQIFTKFPFYLAFLVIALIIILIQFAIVYIIRSSLKEMKKRRNELGKTDSELKNYKHFNIITNKRYIRRDYYADSRFNIKMYKFDAFEVLDNILFVSLEKVNKVILNEPYKRVSLLIEEKKSNDQNGYIEFYIFLSDKNEWDSLIEIFNRLIPKNKLNLIKKKKNYIHSSFKISP